MIRVAITGGIACGKSMAGQILARQGWGVCDADHVAHQLYAPDGEAYDAVCELFGPDVVQEDGRIDRFRVGARVFSNQDELVALNQILHPIVQEKLNTWLANCEARELAGAAVIVPLLFEAGLEQAWDLDAIVCIGCKPDTQRQRLLDRGLDLEAIRLRISAQWPLHRKMKAADFEVWNDGSLDDLEECLLNIVSKISERK
jgi:dephospho-CoA kinase